MDFLKITGSGNDFVLCDNRRSAIKNRAAAAIKVCRLKFGVGADGLVLLEKSTRADFRMKIFNPDGSEAEMCGNGLRCLVRFLRETGISAKQRFRIETLAGIYETGIRGASVFIRMFLVEPPKLNLSIPVDGKPLPVHFLNTGVPHAVIVTDDADAADVAGLGRKLRFHDAFAPKGTNVDWLEIRSPHHAKVRTYERGVEGETLACGTGIVASTLCGALLGRLKSPVSITARSEEPLSMRFSPDLEEIFFEGRTLVAFKGSWVGR